MTFARTFRLSRSTSALAVGLCLALPAAAGADDPPADTAESAEGDAPLPGEGGELPRAPMPEGGVEKDLSDPADPKEAGLPLMLDWFGFVRILGELVEDDDLPFIGRNDGFQVANARIGLDVRYGESWKAVMSLDTVVQVTGFNDVEAELSFNIRDAFLEYNYGRWVAVRAGRFKAPYDLADLESTGARSFIDLPVYSGGVTASRGIEVPGMRQNRETGVMVHSDRMKLTEDGFDLGYAVALTNGRTNNLLLNDNDSFAGFARLSLHWGKWVSVHGGGFMDSRTVGELPNLFDEDVWGVEGALEVSLFDLKLQGEFLYQNTAFPTSGVESINAMGFHAQWTYTFFGVELGYRFAYYDPNDRFDADRVSEHTVLAAYNFSAVPVRLVASGTLADEERDVDNNRITLLGQFVF